MQSDDDEEAPPNRKLKEYNAQIRKDFRNEGFDSKGGNKFTEEDVNENSEFDDDLDDRSDDEFLDNLKKK
jgi:hypothetical protein